MKFTQLSIEQLKPKEKRYLVYEEGGKGLAIRVAPTGSLTFVWVYRYNKKLRYYTLGKINTKLSGAGLSLKEARKKVADAHRLLAQGIDPAVAEKTKITKNITDPTIEVLANKYMEDWAKPRKRSWKEDARILSHDVLPAWSKRKAVTIKRLDVIALLEEIKKRGSPIMANRVLAMVRRMFNFAIERDLLEVNSCTHIKPIAKENRRDRVLTQKELQLFWHGLNKANMSEELKILLKLMLLTAQRKGELITAEWKDIDMANCWWTIPDNHAKNGLSHRVYLAAPSIQLLKQLNALNPDSIFLFPSPNKKSHMTAACVSRAIIRSQEAFIGIEAFTPHDLRRTAASYMTGLGINRLVVSKILNHVDNQITAVYDRHSYDKEKQVAMEQWEKQLGKILCAEKSLIS